MASNVGSKGPGCRWLLWNYRSRNGHWFRTRIHEYQPDQNADLERGLKRHCCSTDHDRHGGYYFQEKLDGTF